MCKKELQLLWKKKENRVEQCIYFQQYYACCRKHMHGLKKEKKLNIL